MTHGEPPIYCVRCGNQIPESHKFCSGCGKSVQSAPVPPPIHRSIPPPPPPNSPFREPSPRPAESRWATVAGTRDERTSGDYIYPSNPPQRSHACWLNLLVSGVAQMYLGQIGKGLAILGAAFASYFVVSVSGQSRHLYRRRC
ncbi:MAG: zinc ribbon domain-containing protein [Pirellulaceae bacterium]